MIIGNPNFSIMLKPNRGEPTRPKNECSKSNVPIAAKPLWCPSSLQQASQFTAERASRSTRSSDQKMAVQTSVLTRNKPGPDEETTGTEEKRKNPPASSNGSSANLKQALFGRRQVARFVTVFVTVPSYHFRYHCLGRRVLIDWNNSHGSYLLHNSMSQS